MNATATRRRVGRRLEGKVAVLTGATSGLALETARLFAREGARVVVTGRDGARLDAALAQIGSDAHGVQADASDLEALDRLYEDVARRHGAIDVLMTSAADTEFLPLGQITEGHVDRLLDVNVRGVIFTVHKALPLLRDSSAIILTGSISSVRGFPGGSVYAATKAALPALARTWAAELAHRRIRVNVLSPGPIQTPAMDRSPPEDRAAARSSIPRGELGTTLEIATAALFLAGSDSSFVNGTELFVDGGTAQV